MLAWWVADLWQHQPAMLVSWVYWVVFSIVLHELAHGWAAVACGDRTPIESGHMTWNPLVHMGPMSLMMFALVGIAWGMMPVDPTRFRRRFDQSIVSAAGPVMNLLLAGLALVLYGVWIGGANASAGQVLRDNVDTFLRVGLMLNLTLCLFNLLPVPPLDGSRIVANFVPAYRRVLQSEQGQYLALGGLVLVFMFAGKPIFGAAAKVTNRATNFVESVVAAAPRP